MGTIILAGVIIFLTVMTFVGYKRGLIKAVFSLLSTIIVLVVVTILTPTARILIKETPVYEYIQERTEKYVYECIGQDFGENTMAGIGVKEQKRVINKLPVPQNIKDTLIENNTEKGYKDLEVTNFVDYIVNSITNKVVDSITVIILFVIVMTAVKVAVELLDIIAKLPILNVLNKSGGAAFGFAEALVFIWIACVIVTAFGATKWGQQVLAEINNNVLLSAVYNYNMVEKVISMFF